MCCLFFICLLLPLSYFCHRSGVPIIGMSALTGKGAEGLLPAAVTMYERWNQRVPTSRLNRWLEQVPGCPYFLLSTYVRWP